MLSVSPSVIGVMTPRTYGANAACARLRRCKAQL